MTQTTRPDCQVTIRDVAKLALVSIGTVSRVLNNVPNVEPELRLRVLRATQELGYVHRQRGNPATHAGNGEKDKKTISRIAFCCRAELSPIAPSIQNHYFSLVLQGVEAECRHQDLHILYSIIEDEAAELSRAQDKLRKSGADALLLVNFINEELVSGLLELGLPAILIDHFFPDLQLDVVMNQNYPSAMRAMRYLIESGHRRIGFLDGPPHYTIQRRRDGYRAALENAGIPFDPELVIPGNLYFDGGGHAADEIIRRKLDCTAFFCANDTSAIGLIQGLLRNGVRVPEDISVVGFDDIEAAKLISPALTTVRANPDQLGRMAVIRLLERCKDPTLPVCQTLLHSTLVERNSVRKI
jgi:LacI family transcriptional regulator